MPGSGPDVLNLSLGNLSIDLHELRTSTGRRISPSLARFCALLTKGCQNVVLVSGDLSLKTDVRMRQKGSSISLLHQSQTFSAENDREQIMRSPNSVKSKRIKPCTF